MESNDTTADVDGEATTRMVFRAHIDRVYGYLIHRLGGRVAVAEELTRDVFVAVLSGVTESEDAEEIEAHLLSAARRELIVFLERAARKPDLVLGPASIRELADSADEEASLALLENLPIDTRLAVTLRHIDQLPVGLVAEATGETVKSTEAVLGAATVPNADDLAKLAVLDRSVAPDTAFSEELEHVLVGRAGLDHADPSPSVSLSSSSASSGSAVRFGTNNWPRLGLALLAVVALITALTRMTNDRTDDDQTIAATSPTIDDVTTTSETARPTTTSVDISTTTTTAPTATTSTTETAEASDESVGTTSTTRLADDTPRTRPASDPAFLDRGPLAERRRHDTIWTGAEMIIWGGTSIDGTEHLTDGATYDPRLLVWEVLAPSPLDEGSPSVAFWAGDQVIVVSAETTVAYRHWLDDWVPLGEGIDPGPAIWTGQSVVLANSDGISEFDPAEGTWTSLPDPGIRTIRDEDGEPQRMIDPYEFGFHLLDGDLYFVRGCGPNIWRWTGSTWSATARPSFDDLRGTGNELFCAWANQTAVVDDRLLVWSDDVHPSIVYDPQTDSWEELDAPPLPPTEGPAGGITIGDQVLAINWEAAIYDATTKSWAAATLPGEVGGSSSLVWTGQELLFWTALDAWRTDVDAVLQ